MAYYGSYSSQGVGRALQNFRHRMSKAFNWSQPYEPSAREIDKENSRRWRSAARQSIEAPEAPRRYSSAPSSAASRAARAVSQVPAALGRNAETEEYLKKAKKAPRILDLFK